MNIYSLLNSTLKRLVGDERGSTVVEYAIYAVLIAAAVKIAASYMHVAGDAMIGTTKNAETRAWETHDRATVLATQADATVKRFKKIGRTAATTIE